jgi:hypothetical protein
MTPDPITFSNRPPIDQVIPEAGAKALTWRRATGQSGAHWKRGVAL